MFARRHTFKYSALLILFSALVCAPLSQAQQQATTVADPAEGQDSSDDRRIERLGDVSADEWEMNLALPSAAPPASAANGSFELPDAEQEQQLQSLLSSLANNPGSKRVLTDLNALLADVLDQANGLMDEGSAQQAGQMLQLIQSVNPKLPGLNAAKARLLQLKDVDKLIASGRAALDAQRLLQPDNDSAFFYFEQALKIAPANPKARTGLEELQTALIARAFQSVEDLDFEVAAAWLSDASGVLDNPRVIEEARLELEAAWEKRAADLEQDAIAAMNSGDFDRANMDIIDLIALGGHGAKVDALRTRLEEARVYGGFEPGQVIHDDLLVSGGKAPAIIVVPSGSYLMGSRKGEENEQPQHRVIIKRGFGLGVREVSVEEFRLFIERTGYRTAAERTGKSSIYYEAAGRLSARDGINWENDYAGKKAAPEMPVIHVNAYDADAYIQWLVRETGKKYRLPSEAEFEYVARAGGSSTYWWGEGAPAKAVENLTGERDRSPGQREWTTFFKKYGDGHWGPAPVSTVSHQDLIHPMGVYDIAGNISEWTQDCWHQNYLRAPVDGSAWVNPGCVQRVVRGGYWASGPEQSRAAFRMAVSADRYGPVIGFRVARDL
jgi:formylglycine-generating enzyme required for sulfatase activity